MYRYPLMANRSTTKIVKSPQTYNTKYNQTPPPPPQDCWNKIETIYEKRHHVVDWKLIHLTTKKSTRPIKIWATIIASRQLLTGTGMGKRGACSSDECPRGYGKITEDKQHLFQCSKGNNKCDKLKKILLEWGERNRAAPQIISAILHGISKWRKGQMPSNPPPQPLDVARDFENQTNIGWLQALIGLTEGSWDEIQNMHLQLLEKKTTGKRWISYLLRKLWDTA